MSKATPVLLAGSLSLPELCPHHLLQPNLHSPGPRSKSTQPELQRESEAPPQELPGRVQELAQGWLLTGQVKLRNRWAPPACLHHKLKHPDRNFSQLLQTPALEEYLRAAPVCRDGSWLSYVLHKWMANVQTKMPAKIFTLGARLLRPILGSWHFTSPHFHWICNTTSVPEKLYRIKRIFLVRVSALSQVAHFWNGGRREQVLHTYYYGIVSFMTDISFKQIITFILKKPIAFSKTALSVRFHWRGQIKDNLYMHDPKEFIKREISSKVVTPASPQ